MDFRTGLARAYDTKWSYINTFTVEFLFTDYITKEAKWTQEDIQNINIHIKSISTPTYTNQPIEAYIGDKWHIQNGRNEMWRFTISFRDSDKLRLYRKFLLMYQAQKDNYFDDVKTGIKLYKDADYADENSSLVFDFAESMVESVSQVQFSNETEAQIAEFDVEFKCVSPVIGNV